MQGRYYEDPHAFDQLMNRQYQSKEMFVDKDFQAADENIIDPNDIVDDLMDLGPVNWRRASDIPALVDQNG